jgi:hypothetical protein
MSPIVIALLKAIADSSLRIGPVKVRGFGLVAIDGTRAGAALAARRTLSELGASASAHLADLEARPEPR